MKILGLDIGSAWVGSALSDGAGITCRPYKTVRFDDIESFLDLTFKEERIEAVIVGHPVTVGGGTKSAQTQEIELIFDKLKERFARVDDRSIEWILRDERYSSKRAASIMKQKRVGNKEEKNKEHSIAAAFILQCYLDSKALQRLSE